MTERTLINVYCDESCHLLHDHQSVMVLGGVWLPDARKQSLAAGMRQLKEKHGFGWNQEVKWNKISPKRLAFFLDLIDFFFTTNDLHFRAWVAPKGNLKHDYFCQDHNTWYYKMYYDMLKQIFSERYSYSIYLDIKDTRGGKKTRKLHEVICNSMYDFDRNIVKKIQLVRSDESEFIQLADILIGALSYVHRNIETSEAKKAVIEHIRKRSGHTLLKNSLPREEKFNLYIWQPQNC
ncbi:MAG: DUF3800 domain-containing protein [Candidatus Vecturithrix sp.]|jgi:hypothetical protein|nr:DUF3800 domain-containing protein [Candidatus Vecturithrix sp.]